MSDMLCEKHLDLEWPHEDCPGPGVPIISGMRARISELETELLKQYRRVEDLISDSRVMERESAALRKRVEELEGVINPALEGLERVGWPCRLQELPDLYNKLAAEFLGMKARAEKAEAIEVLSRVQALLAERAVKHGE